jgi:ribosomal protein L21
MHVDYVAVGNSQSAISKVLIDTLGCTLEETTVVKVIIKNPAVKQAELVIETEEFLRSIKRIIASLHKKQYIRRVNGKRQAWGKIDEGVQF